MKLKKEDFQFEVNYYGYMLFYKQRPLGGASILPDAIKPRNTQKVMAQIDDHAKEARREIEKICQGCLGHYKEALNKIIEGENKCQKN